MSCPDWRTLIAHRFDPQGREPAGWDEALGHLDDCPTCRREALALDASLAFREPRPVAAPDVEALLAGVRTLRRHAPSEPGLPWRQTAAAVLLLAGGLWVAPSRHAHLAAAPEPIPFVENMPVLEAVDRPDARIYQLADDELSMVMIVDETLDV